MFFDGHHNADHYYCNERKTHKYSGGDKGSHDLGIPNAHYSPRHDEEVNIPYKVPLTGQGKQTTSNEAYCIGGGKINDSGNELQVYTNVI